MVVLVSLLAGAFFLLGALVAWRARDRGRMEDYSLAVASGSLACVAVIDLAPETMEFAEKLGWPLAIGLVAAGAVVLILLDRALPDHGSSDEEGGAARLGGMALVAVVVHNLPEGAAIYAIATQDLAAGVALAVGVGMHNAPMGMLLYSAMERSRARGIAVLSVAALSPFVGGVIMFALGGVINDTILSGVVCVALGMIAFMLFAELIPTMIRRRNLMRSLIGIAVGVAFVLVGSLFH